MGTAHALTSPASCFSTQNTRGQYTLLSVATLVLLLGASSARAGVLYNDALYGKVDTATDLTPDQWRRVVALSDCDITLFEALECAARWGDRSGDGALDHREVEQQRASFLTVTERAFAWIVEPTFKVFQHCDVAGHNYLTGEPDATAPPDGIITMEEMMSVRSLCLTNCASVHKFFDKVCDRAPAKLAAGTIHVSPSYNATMEHVRDLVRRFDMPDDYKPEQY